MKGRVRTYTGIATILLLALQIGWAGGGKAAYRNYYLGNYYFAEGDYARSLRHLEKAYELNPGDFNFAISLALVLGRTDHIDRALDLATRSETMLPPHQRDKAQLLAIRHFVIGMIYIYDRRFYRAVTSLEDAVARQRKLSDREVLSIMLNALAYARVLDQGKGAGAHKGLAPHWHVHRRDLDRGMATLREALELNPRNAIAAKNYQFICDTLQQLPLVEAIPDTVAPKRYVSAKYKYLPAKMDGLLELEKGEEIIFLLDISGSMVQEQVACVGTDRFNVMKETALLLLENTPDSVQVGLATIGGDCGTEPKQWSATGAMSRSDLRYALGFLYPDGTTPLLTILRETPTLFSDVPGHKSIFFISDGENICNLPGVDICEWAETLAAQNISINVLTFLGADLNNTGAFAEYTCLAENTGGRILYLDANRCSLEQYSFDLLAACQPLLPAMRRVSCWGPTVRELWAIFPED